MKKFVVSTLLILLVLVCASLACFASGGVEGSGVISSSPSACCNPVDSQSTMAVSATETYGAEMFHLQLTAIAGQNQQP